MYEVRANNAVIGNSDTAVFIKVSDSGCYVPCERAEADGVCVKLPVDLTDEETGAVIRTVTDTVFAFPGHQLHGDEPEAEIEAFFGSLALGEAQTVVDILLGGGAE